jgi:ABC-2 type transport system ATP-binding protein
MRRLLGDGAYTRRVEPVVSVRGLRKRYGQVDAVAGIDLEIERGEIFAFLGPNGAGKTTTVEILEGFRTRTGGEVTVLGIDPAHGDAAWRNRVGAVLQESNAEPGLTVRESLQLYSGYYLEPRDIDETIALVGLEEKADTLGPQLSGGQRRRLDVALALIGDPELVFLDEPTTGFDPSARRNAWDVIDGLRELGKTVFLTTHYMDEAEQLADRIAVIAGGRIVAEGTPGTLGGRNLMAATIRFTLPAGTGVDDLPPELRAQLAGEDARVRLTSQTPLVHVGALAEWALARGIDLPDLDVRRPTLEDVYLERTRSEAGRHRPRAARSPSSSTRRASSCVAFSATGRRGSSRWSCRCSSSSSSWPSSETTRSARCTCRRRSTTCPASPRSP